MRRNHERFGQRRTSRKKIDKESTREEIRKEGCQEGREEIRKEKVGAISTSKKFGCPDAYPATLIGPENPRKALRGNFSALDG
jgi:hypothetical protein